MLALQYLGIYPVASLRCMLDPAHVNLRLDDEALVRIRTDGFGVRRLGGGCKVDASAAPAAPTTFEASFEDQGCDLR
eukprot:CAMPEP_0115422016 /NCGR_PEP_ID=MMETSP0271-20121206/26551_1 /TAXON_ID=71861 /ORGANISM="Scrippsiella trochoidea, Strain CCMP3099" /LENGTH=76 /DNA_ID=CAMNT_0002846679 /DNA_START=447 /DNA_END=673 /DNA_ORIENTATION=+